MNYFINAFLSEAAAILEIVQKVLAGNKGEDFSIESTVKSPLHAKLVAMYPEDSKKFSYVQLATIANTIAMMEWYWKLLQKDCPEAIVVLQDCGFGTSAEPIDAEGVALWLVIGISRARRAYADKS